MNHIRQRIIKPILNVHTYTSINVICQGKHIPVKSMALSHSELVKAVESPPFDEWLKRMNLNAGKMILNSVTLQALDMFGPRVGFIKFFADVRDNNNLPIPSATFMRGGSVAVLPIIKEIESGDKYALLVQVNSVPTAILNFPSLPAGMIDANGSFVGNMAREIKEETGLTISEDKLVDLTELTYGARNKKYQKCQNTYQGTYPSVGGTDEYIRLFSFHETLSRKKIMELQGKQTGLAEENEKLTVQIIPLSNLWKETPDAKALSALTLYRELKKGGKIENF